MTSVGEKREALASVPKTDSEQRWKKKVPASNPGAGDPRNPRRRKASEPRPVRQPPSYDVQHIKIADIKIEGKRRALNPDKLKGWSNPSPYWASRVRLRHGRLSECSGGAKLKPSGIW